MDDMELDTIELLDENGEPTHFEHLLTMSYNNSRYLALHPLDDPDVDDGAVVFLEISKDEQGEDVFQNVESEILLDELFEEFLTLVDSMDEEAEFEDEDE